MVKKLINTILLFILCSSLIAQNKLLPTSNGQLVTHKYYILSYSEENEQAEWVFYLSTKLYLKKNINREDDFRPDPLVKTKSANNLDYKNSGYDRGHICPAADMTFDSLAMSETFYFSNMSPQVPSFNRGVWSSLEYLIRQWTLQKDSLYIVTGPVFLNNQGYICSNIVTVPGFYYKIVYDKKNKSMIGFVLPNKKNISKKLSNYIYTIDYIEFLTKIDFFYDLPDDTEKNIEDKVNMNHWQFQK